MPSLIENRTAAHASTRVAGNLKNRPGYQEFISSSRMPLFNRSDAHSDVTADGIPNGIKRDFFINRCKTNHRDLFGDLWQARSNGCYRKGIIHRKLRRITEDKYRQVG